MTLIYSNFSPSAGLIAISDILTSTPKRGEAPSITLPLRRNPISFSSSAYALRGTAQKCVLANSTMIQWADRAIVARALLTELLAATDDGRKFISKSDLFSSTGLSKAELEEASIIYHFRDGPYLRRWEHHCRTINGDNTQLMVAGSGDWHYMENTEIKSNIPNYGPMYFTAEAISRAFRALVAEIHSEENYAFHYGGWLEFATAGENQFDKSPIAIKIWRISSVGELQHLGPLIYCTYHEFDLYIVRLAWMRAKGKMVAQPHLLRVADFLGRTSSRPALNDLKFAPTILCHHVIDERDGSTTNIFDFEWTGIALKLALSDSGIDISYAPSLPDRLLGRTKGPLVFTGNPDLHGTR